MAAALLTAAGPLERLITEKAYDADWLRTSLAEQYCEPVILRARRPSELAGAEYIHRWAGWL